MNLLQETKNIIKFFGKFQKDVEWVGTQHVFMSWGSFKKWADVDYDNSFGGEVINPDLLVVGEDWWLERHEYDGSEWWEYKEKPEKPLHKQTLPPIKEDL